MGKPLNAFISQQAYLAVPVAGMGITGNAKFIEFNFRNRDFDGAFFLAYIYRNYGYWGRHVFAGDLGFGHSVVEGCVF
jgi:hypothetical protein